MKQWRSFPKGHTLKSVVITTSILSNNIEVVTTSILSDQLGGYRSFLAPENIYEPPIV